MRGIELLHRSALAPAGAPLSLMDIALEVGYSQQAHFTRAFRRWMGESPSDYRSGRQHSAAS